MSSKKLINITQNWQNLVSITRGRRSLNLAAIMGWDVVAVYYLHEERYNAPDRAPSDIVLELSSGRFEGRELCPYEESVYGLAQFAAIIKEHPNAMKHCVEHGKKLTQHVLLDTVLLLVTGRVETRRSRAAEAV